MCFASGENKNTRTKSRSLRRWKGITIVPISQYLAAVIWEKKNSYLIFTWHFMFFLVASLLSLFCSLWFRYGLFGHPIQQTRKKILLFFLIAAVDILFYKIVVEITRIFFPAFFVSAFFAQWTLSWGASIGTRWLCSYYWSGRVILE